MGQSMGRRISGLAYRMLLHQHEASWENTWIFTAAVWTIYSRIIRMRSPRVRRIWDINGVITGSMYIILNDKSRKDEQVQRESFLTVSLLEGKRI